MKLGLVAAAVGVLTGLLSILPVFVPGLLPSCAMNQGGSCQGQGIDPSLISFLALLGGILVLVCVASVFGPKIIIYGETGVSILVAAVAILSLGQGVGQGVLYALIGLGFISAGMSIVAARDSGGLSEQSNPMNLPVFG